MNLIQIQEHLKDLPTQAIMGYANGQNPQVPPYMALGEMNRRKSMEQRAAQAPDSSVKEKLESELTQQVALPGIGQGMNMRMNPAGMPQPMPAAQPQMAPRMQPMPVQPAARPMPPQQMSKPGAIPAGAPGMAGGGLAELATRRPMFNYAPGGIVAFAEGDLVELPESEANAIMKEQLAGKVGLPMPVSRDDERKKFAEANPEMGALLNKIPGEKLAALAAKLEEQNQAQRSKFQEGEGRQGLAALSQALISAGEATRGQKGMGGIGAAFGGFGKSYNAATAAQEERAAKQQALERAQSIETMKLQSDVENMQRAFAEGRLDDAMKYKAAIEAREGKIQEIKGLRAKDVLTLADTRRQREEQARHNKAQEKNAGITASAAAQRAAFDREDRPSAQDKLLTKIQANVTGDGGYRTLSKKLQDTEVGSEEYYKILDAMRDIALTYYPTDAEGKYKVAPPPLVKRPTAGEKPAEAQGFWDKFFNGPKATSPAKPTEVPLPPGFKVVQ
jgi:hypothetical protein